MLARHAMKAVQRSNQRLFAARAFSYAPPLGPANSENPVVYFDISIGGENVRELFHGWLSCLPVSCLPMSNFFV